MFVTLNEIGQIVIGDAVRFLRQPIATTKRNVIAEVVCLARATDKF